MELERDPLHIITNTIASMSQSEHVVAEYILRNPEKAILLSMKALAEKIDVSDNTVLRFCRTCGFSGYLDFKAALVPTLVRRKGSIYEQVTSDDEFSIQRDKISKNIDTVIHNTLGSTPATDVDRVAQRIVDGKMTLCVGLGSSSGVAKILSDSLMTFGLRSYPMVDRIQIERTCLSLDVDDVLFGFTHVGETEEVLLAVRRAKEKGSFTVLVSNNYAVAREVKADVFLWTQVPTESIAGDYFALPRIAQLAIVELLLSRIAVDLRRKGDTTTR